MANDQINVTGFPQLAVVPAMLPNVHFPPVITESALDFLSKTYLKGEARGIEGFQQFFGGISVH